MEKVFVVARSFQTGTGEGGKEFNARLFERIVAMPISRLLKAEEVVRSIIVMVNGEKGSRLAEIPNSHDITPTMTAIKDYFPEQVKSGRIMIHLCTNWGPNPGSAIALNEGLEIARNQVRWVLNWSPEIEMDGNRIDRGLSHAERHNLSVVGFLRQNWWEKPQWKVAQNTATLWNIEILSTVNGFAPECNGTGRTIQTKEYGKVPIAGMEDFHTMLRMLKQFSVLRWGMVGRAEPLFWDTDFEPGSEREFNHLQKVARQYYVMQAWAQDIFPELSFRQVMNKFFASYHLD